MMGLFAMVGVFLFLLQLFDIVFTHLYWFLKQESIQKKLLLNHPRIVEIPKYRYWYKNIEPKYCNQSTRSPDWRMRRDYVGDLYKHHCALCDNHVGIGHVHHIVFLKKGGTNSLANLAYLCRSCHASIHPHMWKKRKADLKEIEKQGISENLYYKRKKIDSIEYRKFLKSIKCGSTKNTIKNDVLEDLLNGDFDIDKFLEN